MRIGRYEIERELGRGAMGVVYLARDPRVGRKVAIKTYLLPQGLKPEQEAEFRERFLREAQAAGALSHPSIVTIHDADDDPDSRIPFIVMEYVDGRSLADLLAERRQLPPVVAFEITGAVADALHAAHDLGIVHRDIKPANLLLPSAGGVVKVADFGVARMSSSELTRTGMSMGSPSYMSPEQVQGDPADGRSDLFALAVVLYEALCGERPFKGENLTALAYAVVHSTPIPASKRREGLPGGVDAFFDRALAKDPERRFPDGHSFREAITSLQTGAEEAAVSTLVVLEPGEDDASAAPEVPEAPQVVVAAAQPAAIEESPGDPIKADGSPVEHVVAGDDRTWPSNPAPVEDAPRKVSRKGRMRRWTASRVKGRRSPAAPAPEGEEYRSPWVRGWQSGVALLGATWRGLLKPRGRYAIRRPESADHDQPHGPSRFRGTWSHGVLPATAALLAVGLVFAAAWNADPSRATLIVDGRNGLESGRLRIAVDGKTVYSRELSAEKKQAAIFGRTLFEYGKEMFSGRIRVGPGRVEITAEVLAGKEPRSYRDTIVARLEPGEERTLEITIEAGGRNPVHLDLD